MVEKDAYGGVSLGVFFIGIYYNNQQRIAQGSLQ